MKIEVCHEETEEVEWTFKVVLAGKQWMGTESGEWNEQEKSCLETSKHVVKENICISALDFNIKLLKSYLNFGLNYVSSCF